jgi:3-oxoacyl-[acyl-carrier protein] reductase
MGADNPFDFTGRTALVTGSGSDKGIGFATARLLARLGASVAITATTADRIEARASELRSGAANVFSYVADLTDRRSGLRARRCRRRRRSARSRSSSTAAGMVQTGIPAVGAPFDELTPDDLQRELEITLKTAFHTTQAVLPSMVEQRYGRIVMVSSVTGPT